MGKKVKNRQPRRRPLLEEIEPRILYSADFAPGLVPDTTLVPDAEQRTVDLGGEFAATAQEAQARRHELVLVETDTPDYQKLVDDILKQAGDGRDIEVVLLDASKDGLQQITDILAARQDLSAVHLVSHGADGTVELGATELNFDTLLKNATQIKGWGKSLSADADILIYGCDVAQQSDGKALIDALARLTGADVAASEDLTGAAAQGGNWTLEYRTGGIDTPLAISTAEQFSYSGTLATYTVTNTNDTGAGSLRQAIQNANANGGADTIDFNIPGAGVKTINVMSALPAITGTVVIDGTTQPGFASTPLIEIDGQTQSYEGLYLDTGSDGSTIKGLAINHFMRAILINASSNNVVVGNFLGTDATGTVAKPNWAGVATRTSNNIIGGTSAADRNIISGNSVDGIQITGASGGSGNVVMGNYIGLDVTGTVDLGNTNQGVALYNGAKDNIIGGTAAGAGNVISGNNGEGVRVVTSGTTGNVVVGNLIGTNAAGTAGIANNRGVWIDDTAADNTVGGTAAGAGNVIAYNTLDGVTLTSTAGQGNSVLGNTIHSNSGLGIDLKDDGVTANDGAKTPGEPNLRMDFPVIQAATLGGTTLTVAGYIGTAPNDTDFANARVEFFKSPNAAGVNGQGQVYLGFLTADAFGNFTGALSVSGLAVGDRITGTATDPSGNTSEFALNFAVTPNNAPVLANTVVTLNPVTEDAGGPVGAVGTLISALVGGVSDADGGAVEGIAITAADAANGTWRYSTNNGASWNLLGTPSAASSRLLAADAGTRIYFQPNANYTGTLATAITFRAWDQTSGSNGSTANLTGTFTVLDQFDTIAYSGNNGAVHWTGNWQEIGESDGPSTGNVAVSTTGTVTGGPYLEIDLSAPGIGLTRQVNLAGATSATLSFTYEQDTNSAGGQVALEIFDGSSWATLQTYNIDVDFFAGAVGVYQSFDISSYVDANTQLRFRTTQAAAGDRFFVDDVRIDYTGLGVGGTTAFSSATDTASLTVTAVNDAPVLADTVLTLNAVNEDAPTPVGAVGTLIGALTGGISDVDSGAVQGIAITAADAANGSWWYSTDNGANWNALGAPSGVNSRLLASDGSTRIYFQPNANYNGTVATAITFRAWDRTSGSNGGVANTASNGGTTAFSSATDTASLTVNAINDAPAIGGLMGDVLTYSPGSGAQTVDQSSNAVVVDVDSSDLGGGTLAVTIAAGGNSSEDVLSVRDQGSGAGQIGFSGGNVSYGGVLIGTAIGGSAGTPLMIALNGSATPTAVSALLSNVTYQNTDSVSPTIGTRTLSFTISDGDGGTSGASTAMVTVAATNPPAAADDNYSVNEDASLMVGWWDTQWTRRQQITFDNFARAENLDNFPVLIALDPSNIDYAETQNGGQDLRFFDRDGTSLSYEIERWNEAGTSYVWVNVPRIDASSSADYIWMYYGNASASPAADPAQVWASSYRGVYHLTDSGVAIGESTGNVPDAINNGSTDVAGPIGGARSFDGIDDWIRIGNGVNLAASASALTVSAWVNTNDLVTDRPFIAVSVNGGVPQDSRIALEQSNGGNIRLIIRAEDAIRDVLDTTTNPLSAGSWYYVVGVVDVANDLMQIYVNGSLEVSQTTSFVSVQTSASNSDFAAMGSQDDGTSGYSQGLIDEVRLAAAARSGNWINAEYVNATGGLVTLGGAQSAPATQGVIGNDSDPDSVNLTAVLVSGPVNAAVFTFNADGTFVYTPSLDFAGTDTFTYRVSDGANDSNVATVTITVNPINDAPVLADTVLTLNAVNEDAPTPVGAVGTLIGALTGGISDVDSGAVQGIAITAADTANGSWWYSTDSGASWNALGTPSAASSRLLASDAGTRIAFQPNADYNGAIATAITFRAWDRSSGSNGGVADTTATGGTTPFSSATDTASLTVNPVNDAPVVTAGATTGYTESAGGVVIDNTVTVSDADDTQITGASVTISSGLTAGDVLGFTSTASITGSYNAGTGVVTLSGTDTVAAYQAALRSVTYTSISEDPTASSAGRTIAWQVTDANAQGTGAQTSAVVTSTLSISALADAPVVTAGATTAYTENAAAVAIDNTVAVSDADDTQIAGATVTISAGLTAGDVLGFTNTASITGVYNAGTGVLTLSGTDTLAAYQAALRSVTYSSTSDDPTAISTSRTISWQVTDANSDAAGAASSTAVTSTVNLTALADAPIVTAGAVTVYSENAAGVVIDTTVTVNDADDMQIAGATVTISAGLSAGDVLGFVNTASITGSYNAGTGVLTLSGTDTLAAYQAALRSVTYSSTSEEPTAGSASRSIAWQVTDANSESTGVQTSAVVTSTLNLTALADAPIVTAGAVTAYTEAAAAVMIDNVITVADADDTQIAGATVTIAAALTAGDVLGFVNTASITGSYNAGTGVLTLSGADTLAAYQAALRSVTYSSTSDDPTAVSASRTIAWQVTDSNSDGAGAASSLAVTSTINLTALADAPVVTAGAVTGYTENAAAVAIDNAITVADADDTQIAGATVTIAAGLAAGDVLGFVNTASITGVYNAGTGLLTLSGADTLAAYQAALRSVTYSSTSDDPAAVSASRTIAWQVTDADSDGTGAQTSAGVVSTVNLTALADAPVVTAGAVTAYAESAAAVAIDNTLTVGDADDTQISGATVTIAAGLTAGDVLGFVNTGTITGSYNAGTGVLTLSGADTLAAYQAALRSVTYSSTSADPTAGGASRTIAWQVTDGDSDSLGAQTSVATTSTVNIGAINDDPVAVDNAAATDEDSVLNVAAPGVLADDSDVDGGALTVSAVDGNAAAVGNPVALASGALLTLNADGSYSYDPNGTFEYLGAGESDTDTFVYEVADGSGGFDTATVRVTIDGVNDAPTGADASVTLDEDSSYIFVSSDFGFADADASDNLQGVRVVSLPLQGSLTLGGAAVSAGQLIAEVDIANGELVFTPAAEANGAGYASFAFRVNDGTVDAVGANTVTIDVTAVNDAPDFTQAGNQSRNEDAGAQTVAAFAAGSTGGGADEAGQVLTYNVSNDNNALFVVQPTIDATGTLTYTLAADANGVANVTVWVSDNGGTANGGVDSSASQAFTITVNAVNDAPTLAIGPGQAGAEDAGAQSVAGFAAAAPGGGPDESGQVLSYVVSNDNNALFAVQPTLDAAGNLTYAAAPNAFGTATVTVFVADGGGTANGGVDASAAQTFTITVTPVNDAPVLGANTLTLNQSDSVVLAAANLSAGDVDDSAAGLSFSVINISNGRFEYVSTPGVAITTFSQGDVAGGLVRFVHDGSGNAPAYQVSVSDGALSDGPLAASIIFNPAPLVVLPPPLPVPVPNELPPEPPAPAQEEAPAEQPEGGALVRAVFSPGRIEAEAPEAQFNRLEGGGAPARRYQSVATLNTFVPGPHIDPTLQLLAAAPANLEYLRSVPVDWNVRPAFPDAEEAPRDRIDVLLEQVQLGGMALSVGVVWWASRISGLLGSLLASAPAWRHIDPLPVVGRDEDEEKRWYDTEDRDADANELAIANVLEGAHAAGDEKQA